MKLPTSTFLRLVRQTPGLRASALICVIVALAASVAEIAVALSLIPVMASLGIDAGDKLPVFIDAAPPAAWLLAFAILAMARSALNWSNSLREAKGTQELVVALQSRLYRALARAHWDTVRKISPPQLTSALQTQSYEASSAFSGIVQLATASFLAAGYLVAAAIVLPLVVPVLLIVLVVMWFVNRGRSNRVLEHSEHYFESQTDLHQRYEDWVAIGQIVSLGVDAASIANRFEADARSAASHAVGFSRSYAATRVSYEAAVVATVVVGVPLAWWLELAPALLAFGLVVLLRALPQAGRLHNGYQEIVGASAPLRNIEKLVNELEADPATRVEQPEPLGWERLELAGVGVEDTIRDGDQHSILTDIDLVIENGEWIALVGPTGAGKTTLANVMLMLQRPSAGDMRVDGQATDEQIASRWRAQAAYVPQDVILFDATIRDNLRLHVPEANDTELEAALRRAAGGFVTEQLPDGLDTRAGPGGRWLSGGERQRIGIARALLKKPGFLVLDEPTAALDSGTQATLMEALGKLEHTMTVVLITHRPELMELADRVVEIEDGRIVSRLQGELQKGS